MSCVVGIKADGYILMGADSAATMGNFIMPSYRDKIFVKEPFVYGICGAMRQSQVLRCYFAEPPRAVGQDTEEYLVGPFTLALSDCLRECNISPEKAAPGDPEDSARFTGVEFALVLDGKLFFITQDLAVISTDEYIALGSGGEYAMGAMYASAGLDPKERILKALEAAAAHSPYVKPPFYIVTISEDGSITE